MQYRPVIQITWLLRFFKFYVLSMIAQINQNEYAVQTCDSNDLASSIFLFYILSKIVCKTLMVSEQNKPKKIYANLQICTMSPGA